MQRLRSDRKIRLAILSLILLTIASANAVALAADCDCSPTLTKFDARDCGVVPDARSQKGCGSCWAFAAAAAYEISYLIVNPSVQPADVDVSEQHILSCCLGSCAGTAVDTPLRWMKKHRMATENELKYQAVNFNCPFQDAGSNFITYDWGYVDPANPLYPSRNEIKQAICKHGSVIAAMKQTDKFKKSGEAEDQIDTVYNESTLLPTNHVVTIIGWDDTRDAWLIRNSWGKSRGDWGMNGYKWLHYDSNNIGYDACWVDAKPLSYKTVKVKNLSGKGSYVADLTVAYDINGFHRVDKNSFPIGQSRSRLVPSDATNIRVTARAVGGKDIFSRTYPTATDACFEVWGKTWAPESTACYDKPSCTRIVQVNNIAGTGAYRAELTVTFKWEGEDYSVERKFDAGHSGKAEVPCDATDMRVKVRAIGGKEVINQPYDPPVDVCFDVYGTTLNPRKNACTYTQEGECFKHITFNNAVGSGYAARATVSYLQGGVRKPYDTGSFAIGTFKRVPVPCDATDIEVTARAIGGDTILTKRYATAIDRCFELRGGVQTTRYSSCDEAAGDCRRRITVSNKSAYIAEFTVSYNDGVERQTKRSGSFATGKSREISIPCSATEVTVTAEAVGGKRVFREVFPTARDYCYRVKGTSLIPRYEDCN